MFENNILTERCRKVIKLDELTEAPRAYLMDVDQPFKEIILLLLFSFFFTLEFAQKKEKNYGKYYNFQGNGEVLVEIMMQCAYACIDQTPKCC